MAKNTMACVLSTAALIMGSGVLAPAAWADEGVTASTYEELDALLCKGGDIKIESDIAVDGWLASGCDWVVNKDTTIDFNGHTITSGANFGYNIDFRDATLTLKDSVGGGGYTQLGTNNIAIAVTNGKIVIDGGTVNANTWGLVLWHDSELEMNGGAIHAENLAISGNGTTDPAKSNYGSNVKITINDGELISDTDWAIYNPSENSTIDIYGGKITGGSGAIAANRGVINIYDGEFRSLGTAEVEGDVSQDGTRGYQNAVIGIPKEYGPVTLNISGGTFINENGAELIADVSGLDNENPANVEITGGVFSQEPKAEDIEEGLEADMNEEGTGYVIYPKQIDMQENGEMQSDNTKVGAVAGSATFTKEFITDRKAEFEISTLDEDEFEGLKLGEKGGNLVTGFDVSLFDRDGNQISVNDTELKVRVELDEPQYQALAAFDKVVAINFDEQGNEVERIDASLTNEDGKYYAEFTTTHLSTYALAGVNDEGATEDVTIEEEAETVAAPETGTMTAAGASAVNAALVTSAAVGLLVSIVSFAYLIRKK